MKEEHELRAQGTPSQQLAEKAARKSGITDWKSQPQIIRDFIDVFSEEAFDKLPEHRKWDHGIELKPGSEPIRSRVYPMARNEAAELDKFIEENLRTGKIRPSRSPMAAPVFFIKKKNGDLRLVQDYRRLNAMTIRDAYPIPLFEDLFARFGGARWFSKMDIRWGYNNVRIRRGDEWKAAFRTNRGLFEPLVMFFGLCNSPATFQSMMDELLKDLVDRGVVFVYMDDILVATETKEEHEKVLREVLTILRDNKLYLNADKCQFFADKVEYLGLILGSGKLEMDPVKLAGVRDWPTPRSVRDVQAFLGFANFYRRFIRDFSKIARPLYDLTKKGVDFTWTAAESGAMSALQANLCSAPVLVFPTPDQPFLLEADASNFATGGILSQLSADGKYHPVGYISKSFDSAERNYQIYDKEMLAIMRALEEWRYLLEGAKHPVTIYTDHRNLQYFREPQKLTRRQARYAVELSRFNAKLIHRPGNQSAKPDALSRRADHDQGLGDNQDRVLLPQHMFEVKAEGARVETEGDRFLERIRKSEEREDAVVKAVRELRKGSVRSAEWTEEDGVVAFRGKVYVPADGKLRHDIVKAHHDAIHVGHPGRWKTQEHVARNYWWPRMGTYIRGYVRGCADCNRAKTFPSKPAGPLRPNPIPDRRWQIMSVDLIAPLPRSHGSDAILVVVDRLSKRAHFIPTTTEVDSLGIARLFRDHVWKLHGLPDTVLSDRGTQFVSGFMREFYSLIGVNSARSTAYHPRTDGQTERVNMELELFLRIFVNHRQDDWGELLALAEFAYNNRVHSSTKDTPFRVDSGQDPKLGTEPPRVSSNAAASAFATEIHRRVEDAKSALALAAEEMAKYFDRGRAPAPKFEVGEKVWLDARNIKTDRPMKKLDDRWLGPFPVKRAIPPVNVELELPTSMKIHPVFHVELIRKAPAEEIAERPRAARPPPVVQSHAPEWEVEHIRDSRVFRNRLQYLISWKGYPRSESTWEPAAHVRNAPRIVRAFHEAHPDAAGPEEAERRRRR